MSQKMREQLPNELLIAAVNDTVMASGISLWKNQAQ